MTVTQFVGFGQDSTRQFARPFYFSNKLQQTLIKSRLTARKHYFVSFVLSSQHRGEFTYLHEVIGALHLRHEVLYSLPPHQRIRLSHGTERVSFGNGRRRRLCLLLQRIYDLARNKQPTEISAYDNTAQK